MPISLVLADDHPIMLDGMKRLFENEPDFEVKATCVDGEEALRAVRTHRPAILVLDLRMPRKDGFAVLREMLDERIPTRVVIVTAELQDRELLRAVDLSVGGIVLKDMAPQNLVDCIRTVHAGGHWIENRSGNRPMDRLPWREAGVREITGLLTEREIGIVRLVGRGLRNKEIASRLSITEGTVKVHLHHIYEKLSVDGRVALVRRAEEKGLL